MAVLTMGLGVFVAIFGLVRERPFPIGYHPSLVVAQRRAMKVAPPSL